MITKIIIRKLNECVEKPIVYAEKTFNNHIRKEVIGLVIETNNPMVFKFAYTGNFQKDYSETKKKITEYFIPEVELIAAAKIKALYKRTP